MRNVPNNYIASLLVYRLNKNPKQLTHEDAVEWGKLLLPVPSGKDEKTYLLEKFELALREVVNIDATNESEEKQQAIKSQALDYYEDDVEKTHWRIMAGWIDIKNKDYRLPQMMEALEMDKVSCNDLLRRLYEMAYNEQVDLPPLQNDEMQETDTQTLIDQFDVDSIDISALLNQRHSLEKVSQTFFESYNQIYFDETELLIRQFIDVEDEEDLKKHVRIGMMSYETDLWLQHEVYKNEEMLEPRLSDKCRSAMDDPLETTKWLLLSIAHLCRQDETYITYMAEQINMNINGACKFLEVIEYVAEHGKVVDPSLYPTRPVYEKPDNVKRKGPDNGLAPA